VSTVYLQHVFNMLIFLQDFFSFFSFYSSHLTALLDSVVTARLNYLCKGP